MSTLDLLRQRLGDQPPDRPAIDPFLADHGLRRNPFPPHRTIIPSVLYGQGAAIQRFISITTEVLLSPQPERRALGVVAGTGGGKSHFLQHCEWTLTQLCGETNRKFAIVSFVAGSGRARELVTESFRKADDLSSEQTDFLSAIVARLAASGDATLVDTVQQEDLRGALRLLVEAAAPQFEPLGRDGQYTFERLLETTRRWLYGGTLSSTEQKYLGVFSRISSTSMATRVMREMFALARVLGICEGILLCLDEIETLFSGALRSAQYQGFLQDLRYLFDEAVRPDTRGFSLIVLAAATPFGQQSLLEVNYPMYQRLGFEQPGRAPLEPIASLDDAWAFAQVYIDYEHGEWRRAHKGSSARIDPSTLLSRDAVAEAYQSASSPGESELRRGGRVNQAALLERLHLLVEAKRAR